ncbi:BnaAnng19810D [Brassica napus]|uniref:BnaAnng19810D protein n=1 Tax=Brassica napus TaxID=3708 RepID=A0A078JGY7_BRANA|nr:BnaAnng19810D [Brassica napus]
MFLQLNTPFFLVILAVLLCLLNNVSIDGA